jgi:hypothetical protein
MHSKSIQCAVLKNLRIRAVPEPKIYSLVDASENARNAVIMHQKYKLNFLVEGHYPSDPVPIFLTKHCL